MELAEHVLPTLTAESSMVVRPLDNLVATLVPEFADLAKSMPIALPPLLTVDPTEDAMLALLPAKLAETKMVVKLLTNLTATLLPTFASTSVPLMTNVTMTAFLTVTWNEVAA
jgi:hypothetical protein